MVADPEEARQMAEALEDLRRLAQSMGGAAPVAEALAQSFALIGRPEDRAEYDELRRHMLRYLASLDEGPAESSSAGEPTFIASPDVSEEQLNAFAAALISRAGESEES